ncbi:MAG: leucyl aminopeptidase [Candidatus Pacebacteria bacterium]|nr:leucyl aminopeptidase [Candidatus Paceibacterota bacterium]
MKFTFAKSLDVAPKGFVRVKLTEEPSNIKRVIREDGVVSLEIGAGKPGEMNLRRFIILCRAIIQAAKTNKFRKIALQFDVTPKLFANLQGTSPEEISSIAAQNFEMANFEFNSFKTKPKEGFFCVDEMYLCGKSSKAIEAAARKGQLIGQAVNDCRELCNTPSSDMPPMKLGQAAKVAVKGLPVTVAVFGRKQMEKMGMGAVVGVGKGSAEEPAFIVMDYKGGKGQPIVLAGKGVTFDSGGINLKTDGGHEMHMDMSGGAAVIHTVALAARLKLKKRVIGLIPAVENMPGQHAYRIHDVLKSLSGKTIEVLNTDAEGRVILSDAITYAKKFKPSVVIDVATLTGAAMVALGQYASAVFSRDDKLATTLSELGEETGDYVWRLPLWDEYEAEVKGTVGDVANAQMGKVRYGGAINGAMFLWQFAKDLECPWAHLDIAPRMTATSDEELAKGSAGPAVRLLAAFIEKWKA